MSEDSVAVVKRWYEALKAGDPAPELCHPEVEITNWAEFPVRGPYRGHDGVRRWWDDVSDVFEEMRWEPQSIEAIDERRCLTIQRVAGRFRHTGIDMDFAWGAVVEVRDGKILSAIGYPSPGEARQAAGLD